MDSPSSQHLLIISHSFQEGDRHASRTTLATYLPSPGGLQGLETGFLENISRKLPQISDRNPVSGPL